MILERTRLKYLSLIPITNGLGLSGAFDEPSWPRYIRTTDIKDEHSLRDDVFASQPPEAAASAMLAPGDILMTAAGATIGKSYLHSSSDRACYAGYLVRFRANNACDPRYIAYWMQSSDYWRQVESGAVRSTIDNFSAGRYRRLLVPLRPLAQQRQIADFLDDQVTHIDQASALRAEHAASGRERLQSVLEDEYGPSLVQVAAQRRLISVLDYFEDGDWIEAPFITERGIRLIQTGNIGVGHYREQGFKFISKRTFQALRCKPVRPGDVLISRLGSPVSRACRAPDLAGPAIVSVDVVIARVGSLIDPDYLVQFLSSPRYLAYADLLARGATMQRLSRSQVGVLRLPVIPLVEQRAKVSRVRRFWEHTDAVVAAIERSMKLLAERKRALITAAVTGDFDVSSSGPRAAVAVTG